MTKIEFFFSRLRISEIHAYIEIYRNKMHIFIINLFGISVLQYISYQCTNNFFEFKYFCRIQKTDFKRNTLM